VAEAANTEAAVYSVNQLNASTNPCSTESGRLNDIQAHTAFWHEEPPPLLPDMRREETGINLVTVPTISLQNKT
jgi:hypothetical protein